MILKQNFGLVFMVLTLGLTACLASPRPQAPQRSKPGLSLPYLTVDIEAGVVDLEAVIAPYDEAGLELLACSPNSREYESIVTVAAKPSHIHLALLALGLEPGHPNTVKLVDQKLVDTPPTGPSVEIFFVLTQDGQEKIIPANQWVIHNADGRVLPENRWLFAGSRFFPWKGRQLYLADLNGTVISLVNFGDDLLARQTEITNSNDQQYLAARPGHIPPAGTELIVRIRRVQKLRIKN